MKRLPAVGTEFYKKKGLEKAITIHLSKELHDKLRRLAKKEERSLQITARRILEEWLKREL
jgi:predicted transcriptional regulator